MYMIDLFVCFCYSANIEKEEIRAKDKYKCIVLHTPQPYRDIQLKASHTLQVEDKLFDKEKRKKKRKKKVFFVIL